MSSKVYPTYQWIVVQDLIDCRIVSVESETSVEDACEVNPRFVCNV